MCRTSFFPGPELATCTLQDHFSFCVTIVIGSYLRFRYESTYLGGKTVVVWEIPLQGDILFYYI